MGLEMVSSEVSVIRTGILGGWKYIGFVYPISPKPQTLNPPPNPVFNRSQGGRQALDKDSVQKRPVDFRGWGGVP